jgi:cysteine synthase
VREALAKLFKDPAKVVGSMNSTARCQGLLECYRPTFVSINKNLTAAVFPLMKIFPAYRCMQYAIQSGRISSRTRVIESSSGTMALGLAMICRQLGNPLTIVSDNTCGDGLQRRMRDLGCDVEIVSEPPVSIGYQKARLRRVRQLVAEDPNAWWVNQYDNPANALAYAGFAERISRDVGRVDFVVGAVGSGGSVCGTAGTLRTVNPGLQVVGVDTFGSVLFGQADLLRKLRGLGNSLLPQNLDHTAFDEVHWVTAAEAYCASRLLHREASLFCGGTSGAAWLVARYISTIHPDKNVLFICADDGNRYIDSVYSDSYLQKNQFSLTDLPAAPEEVSMASSSRDSWAFFRWKRRTFSEVTGMSPCHLSAKTAYESA